MREQCYLNQLREHLRDVIQMLVEDALQGGDAASRVCHTWGSWLTQKQLRDLNWTPRSLEQSRDDGNLGTCAVLTRSERGCSAEREQFSSLLVPATTQTPAPFPMACTAALWASSDGCMSKEAFTLPPSLPVQVSGPCTKVDEDYKGGWGWQRWALPPGSALRKGFVRWEHRSRFTLAPRYTGAQRAKDDEWIWREGLKRKRGGWGLKASRWSTTSRCKSPVIATMQVY